MAVVNMVYVPVGNAGNATDPSTGFGAVGYAYNIGKYEVTNAQYADFLKAKGGSNSGGIYYSGMASYGITQSGGAGSYNYSVTSGYENLPVVFVTWFDAARFCNWVGNGQGNGSMETGAYTLNGATSGIVTVNVGATVYIPTEDEWYKAAYYNGATSSYSLYPDGRNDISTADANYSSSGPVNVSYGTPSSYGTYGQGGNAWEWNDAVLGSSWRGLRGGSWGGSTDLIQSSLRDSYGSSIEASSVGFRVASVPEPTTGILAMFASGVLLIRRKR